MTIRGGVGIGASLSARNGTVEVVESAVLDNHSNGDGAGISVSLDHGTLTIDRLRIEGNTAGSRAGLAISTYVADILVTNSTIVGNVASAYAGGASVAVQRGRAQLVNNTIAGNGADPVWGFGAGLYLDVIESLTEVSLDNNILWGNTSAIGGDLYLRNFPAVPRASATTTSGSISLRARRPSRSATSVPIRSSSMRPAETSISRPSRHASTVGTHLRRVFQQQTSKVTRASSVTPPTSAWTSSA